MLRAWLHCQQHNLDKLCTVLTDQLPGQSKLPSLATTGLTCSHQNFFVVGRLSRSSKKFKSSNFISFVYHRVFSIVSAIPRPISFRQHLLKPSLHRWMWHSKTWTAARFPWRMCLTTSTMIPPRLWAICARTCCKWYCWVVLLWSGHCLGW